MYLFLHSNSLNDIQYSNNFDLISNIKLLVVKIRECQNVMRALIMRSIQTISNVGILFQLKMGELIILLI